MGVFSPWMRGETSTVGLPQVLAQALERPGSQEVDGCSAMPSSRAIAPVVLDALGLPPMTTSRAAGTRRRARRKPRSSRSIPW